MKRVEVKLSLAVVAPLLDVIKAVGDSLSDELAAPLPLDQLDADLRGPWREELLAAQNADVATLLALFDSEFFSSGVVGFDGDNAEAIVRACASVRLRLREKFLSDLPDDMLEGGDVMVEDLEEQTRKAFLCYLFLATVQELIIQHLDASILGG
tara:strand:- start:186 stop:647 length:462 start_codon:yes stop_codon:yes gene_type:complete